MCYFNFFVTTSSARRTRLAAAGAAALVLAAAGEAIIRSGRNYWLGLALYAAAAAVLAPGALPALAGGEGRPVDASRGKLWLLVLGLGISLLAGGMGLRALWFGKDRPATIGWIASVALALAAAILAGRRLDVPARWGAAPLPATRAGKILAAAAVAVILAVSAATRLAGLGKVPFGINPDEGDRAAPAMRILLGTDRALGLRLRLVPHQHGVLQSPRGGHVGDRHERRRREGLRRDLRHPVGRGRDRARRPALRMARGPALGTAPRRHGCRDPVLAHYDGSDAYGITVGRQRRCFSRGRAPRPRVDLGARRPRGRASPSTSTRRAGCGA